MLKQTLKFTLHTFEVFYLNSLHNSKMGLTIATSSLMNISLTTNIS